MVLRVPLCGAPVLQYPIRKSTTSRVATVAPPFVSKRVVELKVKQRCQNRNTRHDRIVSCEHGYGMQRILTSYLCI